LKKKVEKIEANVLSNRRVIREIDKELTENDIFTNSPDKAVALSQRRVNLAKLIEDLEDEWLTALDAYETAKDREGLD